MDRYEASGAVVDVNQWPQMAAVPAAASLDFLSQGTLQSSLVDKLSQIWLTANTFISSQTMDPTSTLYIIFFGIG
jgi:hypothetical protein